MAGDADIIPPAQTGQGPAPQGGYQRAPDYRQLQSPAQMTPYFHLPDNGAAARAAALGNVFKEFEETGAAVGVKLAAKSGATAGAQAGLDPNFQPKTGLAAITSYGDAYNSAAAVTYTNQQHTAIEGQLSQLEQDNAGDPVAFAQQALAVHEGVMKEAPALFAPELSNYIAQRTQAGVTRLREQSIVTARSDAFESYTSTTDSRINSALQTASTLPDDQQTALFAQTKADNRTQLDALVQARAITPERSAILQNKFEAQMTQAAQDQYTNNTVDHMMDLARAGDVDAAERAMVQYLKDPANSDSDKAAVTKQYGAQLEQYTQLQSKVHANDLANVGQSLVQGKYGPDIEPQIHNLYKIGAINPELQHSLMDQSMRNQVASIQDDASNQLVDAAVHGGTKLDPGNKDVVKAADSYYRSHVALNGVAPLSNAWTIGAVNFTRQTNVIPPTVTGQIRIGLLSGNPDTAARAAAAGERIRSVNPGADPYESDPRSAALAFEINSNLKAGMPAATAYQTATAQINKPRDEKEVIAKNYEGLVKTNPNANNNALQSAMDSAVPGLFAKAPPAPIALQAENERLVRTYYGMTGDINTARTLAAKQVQTTWGVSQANGAPELVKYPPERLGISPDLIRSDVASSVKAAGYQGDPSQVRLTPNANTDASGGKIWTLTHTDPTTGLSDVLLDNQNRPLQYHVPTGPDFAKARQELINQKLDAARAQRDEDRRLSADPIAGEQELSNFYLRHPSMN